MKKSCQMMNPLLILPLCNCVESILGASDAPGQQLQWILKRERESKESVFLPLMVAREQ